MPVHYFETRKAKYIRETLRLGGRFWEQFESLPFEAGLSFTFLPVDCPVELASHLEEPVLGQFADLSGFREEEAFVQGHLHRHSGNIVLFGMDWSADVLAKKGCRFEVRQVHTLPDPYYSRGLLLHGVAVTMEDIRDAISLAECPFVLAALLETTADDPVEWLEAKLSESDHERIRAATVSLMVEAYRGEGILFWSRK